MKSAQYNIGSRPPPVLLAALPAALAVQWAAARAPEVVERLYARGLYPPVARALGRVTALAPFSVGETALLIAVAWFVWRLIRLGRAVRRGRGQRWRVLGSAAARALVACGLVYACFLFLWGLNYHRLPFAVGAGLGAATSAVAVDELTALCRELVVEANATRDEVTEDERGVVRLAGGLEGTFERSRVGVRTVSTRYPLLAGPSTAPKRAALSIGLSYLGITGVYSPFTAEAHVNTTLPAFEVPFSASHELAHQAGVAREDEANFVAYLSCRLHPDADFRYAGAFNAALYALGALAEVDAPLARREARWSPAVQRDLKVLAEWNARYRGPAQRASRAVNNAYLKAQGQEEGVRSYGRMVDLLVLERRARRARPRADTGEGDRAGGP